MLRLICICSLLLTALQAHGANSYGRRSYGSSYSSRNRDEPDAERPAVVVVVGAGSALTLEQAAVLKTVWDELKETHTYSEDGELEAGVAGEPMSDRPEIVAAFYRWISRNKVQKQSFVLEKCTACPGSGTVVVYEDVQRLRFTRERCEACEGTGRRKVMVTYDFVCPSDRLPPKGLTPRQVKQAKLESDAVKGGAAARLQLASVYRTGTPIVARDEAKALDMYYELANEGETDALKAYAEMLSARAIRPMDKRLAMIMGRAWARLAGQTWQDAAPELSYLEQVENNILAEQVIYLFAKKSLGKKQHTYASLVNMLEEKDQSPARAIVISQMKEGDARYGNEVVGRLMTLAEALDRDAIAILASISEAGVGCAPNQQAAYIYYSMAARIKDDPIMRSHKDRLSAYNEPAVSAELLEAFSGMMPVRRCPRTFIQAIFNLKSPLR